MNELAAREEFGLSVKNNKIVANSRRVAEVFEKKHREVIRAIEGYDSNTENKEKIGGNPLLSTESKKITKNQGILRQAKEIGEHITLSQWFIPNEYLDSMNRQQREYEMTFDGFTLLVMGFSGAKALKFKIAYINAFNNMAQELKASKEWRLKMLKGHTSATLPYALQELGIEPIETTKPTSAKPICPDKEQQGVAVAKFVADALELSNTHTPLKLAFEYYLIWCRANKTQPLGKNSFSRELMRQGIKVKPGYANATTILNHKIKRT